MKRIFFALALCIAFAISVSAEWNVVPCEPATAAQRAQYAAGVRGAATQLAVTGGAHTATDAIKAVMCGASAVQVVAAVLRSGPQRLREMRVGMESWMAEHEYTSVESMRGCLRSRELHAHPADVGERVSGGDGLSPEGRLRAIRRRATHRPR